jgi:hypothetical protein
MSARGQEVDDLLDGLVGTMVGDFEAALGSMLWIRAMVETAVGDGSAQPLMEE